MEACSRRIGLGTVFATAWVSAGLDPFKGCTEMKLLVAYDGSACSDAALDDLLKAGLPQASEAHVISVAEIWFVLGSNSSIAPANPEGGLPVELAGKQGLERDNTVTAEAEILANHARQRIRLMFPDWPTIAEGVKGSPASAILERAAAIDPDLIVVGSHGSSAISRFFLGSISQKILTEARCCVRVARGRIKDAQTPTRLIVGFDGSSGAQKAVSVIASRSWPASTEIRVVVATGEMTPPGIGRFVPPTECKAAAITKSDRDSIERLAAQALTSLQAKNVLASLHVHPGNPKEVIVEEARRWNADCIFLGSSSFGREADYSPLGSTSAAIAARATCSVEVVRNDR